MSLQNQLAETKAMLDRHRHELEQQVPIEMILRRKEMKYVRKKRKKQRREK